MKLEGAPSGQRPALLLLLLGLPGEKRGWEGCSEWLGREPHGLSHVVEGGVGLPVGSLSALHLKGATA